MISGFLVGYLTAWLIKVIKVLQWITGLLVSMQSGYGAAILAAVGCEVYENVESASLKLSKEKMVIKPEKYNQRYQKFKELYPEMKELFGKLN